MINHGARSKGENLKKLIKYIVAATFLLFLTGCSQVTKSEKKFLTLDFEPNQTLRYYFRTTRVAEIDWGTNNDEEGVCSTCKKKIAPRGKSFIDEMNLDFSYKPVEVDPYGLTTIEAKCESVGTRKSAPNQQHIIESDAIDYMNNKTFNIKIGPTGKIEDHSQLEQLIKTAVKKAFRKDTKKGRIKEPDLISDFFATQWFLWDAVSSIPLDWDGVEVGQTWKSKLSVPTPMLMWEARDVNYTLSEIKQTPTDELAVIRSTYTLSDSVPESWPFPYEDEERFKASGAFGFLINYEILELKGQGEEIFNITKGRTEKYEQTIYLKIKTAVRFPVAVSPIVNIKQSLTMERPGKKIIKLRSK
jgi:hypothetical protein